MVETKMLFLFLILVVLLGCSAFFSGSETALMAITRLRLKLLGESKPRRAAMVEKVLKNPEKPFKKPKSLKIPKILKKNKNP